MKKRSLQYNLLRKQIGIIIFIVFIFSIFYFSNIVFLIKKSHRENLITSLHTMALNLSTSVAFQDYKEAKKVLHGFQFESSVEAAYITTPEGKEFSQYQGSFSLPSKLNHNSKTLIEASENEFLFFSIPIFLDSDWVGNLHVKVSLQFLMEEMKRYGFVILGILLFSIILAVGLTKKSAKIISIPIEALSEQLKKIGETRDYSTSFLFQEKAIEIQEIEILFSEFQNMMNQIKKQDQVIQESNLLLEKRVEERTKELAIMQSELIENQRLSALGEMAGGIAHEVNNPLAIISGRVIQIQKILSSQALLSEKLGQYLMDIEKTVLRIVKIINGLRSISRDGSSDPFETVSIATIINDTLALCQTKLKNSGVNLMVRSSFPDISMECSSVQISQVLFNLVGNASDAVAELPEKWISIEVSLEGHYLKVTVTDSGKGIPVEIREKIMNPFFTTKPVNKGTGLGLSIAKKIIERHQGKLFIETNCPNTQFVILLPQKQNLAQIKDGAISENQIAIAA